MEYSATSATKKVAALRKRIRAVAGGTSASKTISILLVLISAAQSDRKPTVTSVVSETFPHLKRGAIRDFMSIMEGHNYWDDARWNATDFIYTFETGSRLEFFSADQPAKVRGPRRDRLFINEANNVPYETFSQLEVRTREVIFLDWNPASSFWFYEDVQKRDDVDFLTLTYKDNEALPKEIVRAIEQRKGDVRWWSVYGEGKLGSIDGQIYSGWQFIDEIPFEARLERRGLDFGYTLDPTAIVDIYTYNGGYIFDELEYRTGMKNREIGDVLLARGEQVLVIADAAEPKSIDEIHMMGIPIIAAAKGPGSVQQGIQYVQDQRISVTKRSLNLIKEYRNYVWQTDREGRKTKFPVDMYNHLMDAIRYGLNGSAVMKRKEKREAVSGSFRGYYNR